MPKLTEAHFQARRQQILDATFRCLAQKGYSRMTIQDIAAEAGLSVGTLYLYFQSKPEMVRALSEQTRKQTDTELHQQFRDDSPLEMLASIFDYVLRSADDPAMESVLRVDVQIWAEALFDEELGKILLNELEGRVEDLAALVSDAQKAGHLDERVSANGLARIFMAILSGLTLQKAADPELSLEDLAYPMRSLLRIEEGL